MLSCVHGETSLVFGGSSAVLGKQKGTLGSRGIWGEGSVCKLDQSYVAMVRCQVGLSQLPSGQILADIIDRNGYPPLHPACPPALAFSTLQCTLVTGLADLVWLWPRPECPRGVLTGRGLMETQLDRLYVGGCQHYMGPRDMIM